MVRSRLVAGNSRVVLATHGGRPSAVLPSAAATHLRASAGGSNTTPQETNYYGYASAAFKPTQCRYLSDVTTTENKQPVEHRTSKDGVVGWPIDFDVASKVSFCVWSAFLSVRKAK